PVSSAILDGEIVALRDDGVTDFQKLQSCINDPFSPIVYFVFDLLYLNGYDLRKCPLKERKELLARVFADSTLAIRYVDHLEGHGEAFREQCLKAGVEGVISKRADKPYRGSRSREWLKVKFRQQVELVIGGFTITPESGKGLSSLIVGYFNEHTQLVYAGRVGSGLTLQQSELLRKELTTLATTSCPFDRTLSRQVRSLSPVWVDPVLVVRVEYSEWTKSGHLRHPVFIAIRRDVTASTIDRSSVTHDLASTPIPAAQTKSHTKSQSNVAVAPRQFTLAEQRQLTKIQLTHPNKVLFPDIQASKLDLAKYFAEVAPWMLPHLKNRPLSLVRCPDGVEGERFFQKHDGSAVSAAVGRIQAGGEERKRLVIRDLAGLASLAQINAVELHVPGVCVDKMDLPNRITFDLDPAVGVNWQRTLDATMAVRDYLVAMKLESFVKLSGNKGLHVVVPIVRRHLVRDVKRFSQQCARELAKRYPEMFTASPKKEDRVGRIYLDYQRNHPGATTVAAYSPRARADGAVSLPVAWDELANLAGAACVRLTEIREWLPPLRHDPWERLPKVRQSLPR
ncbi:MAG: DNA ligase D, partial [Planctomycetales bacterium]|nr:DNA ligase D [Planctomycetales bacterium]